MIKLVAFDLDGTIGDTIPLCMQAFRMAVEPYIDYKLTDVEISKYFGLDEDGMIRQIISDDNWEMASKDFYTIYQEMHGLCPRPFEGMPRLIKDLKEKSIPVALVTGKGKRSCDITLKHFFMERYFDSIETGSSQKNRKSEAMKKLLVDYGLEPDEMVYIGDAVSDITECNKAGIKCLSAAWAESADKEELTKQNDGNVFLSVSSLKDELFALISDKNK